MLTINKEQQQAFSNHSLKKFEDDMLQHVQEFFPGHFFIMGETGIRNTIRYGYLKAKSYGFFTKRSVCLYLNIVFVLGSNFDSDPQYPWVQEILNDKGNKNTKLLIDSLSLKAEDVFNQIKGRQEVHLNRALLNFHNNSGSIYQDLLKIDDTDFLEYLNLLFPQKCNVIGETNLNKMILLGYDSVDQYDIKLKSSKLFYCVFMFFLGSGFDNDPQFPWAKQILKKSTITNDTARIKILYDEALTYLDKFLKHYDYF